MTTLDEAHAQRWYVFGDESVVGLFVAGHAMTDFFMDHPDVGSPIGAEADWDGHDGGRIQTFSGGIVVWEPGAAARRITR